MNVIATIDLLSLYLLISVYFILMHLNVHRLLLADYFCMKWLNSTVEKQLEEACSLTYFYQRHEALL